MKPASTIAALFMLAILCLESCNNGELPPGAIIISEAPAGDDKADLSDLGLTPGARIVALLPGSKRAPKILTGDFYAAFSPEIHSGGRRMLFSASLLKGDPLQIWEMDFENLKYRKVITSEKDCTDPAYLPGNSIVFCKAQDDTVKRSAVCLYTARSDGSEIRQITFNTGTYKAPLLLHDGRLLAVSEGSYADSSVQFIAVLRPDGTKADLFYKCGPGGRITGTPEESADGEIVFTESRSRDGKSSALVSVNYNRPLHSAKNISAGTGSDYNYILPLGHDGYLVSSRDPESGYFSVQKTDFSEGGRTEKVYSNPGFNTTEIKIAVA